MRRWLTFAIVGLAAASASAQRTRRPASRVASVPISLAASGQEIGGFASWHVSLGDADGDGDLDAFVSNWHPGSAQYSRLWLNDGYGTFVEGAQRFPAGQTAMTPGDLDGDGDLDLWCGGHVPAGQDEGQVWLNNGEGRFARTDQSLLTGHSTLGDVDGDGDLDALVVNFFAGARLYRNNGEARFDAGTDLNLDHPGVAALGDLDGDGDLDAYITRVADYDFILKPDQVWINDGNGVFSDSGQALGLHQGFGVSLDDVDGDGDLDALVGNLHQPPDAANPPEPFKLYLNDGRGFFADSGHDLGVAREGVVAFADLDGHGLPEAVLFRRDPMTEGGANTVLVNRGGRLVDMDLDFGDSATTGGAVGDLDGDGDLDIFCANAGLVAPQGNRVWFNLQPVSLPVEPRVLVNGQFQRSEGIAFNGRGDLYVTANWSLWRVSTEGEVEWLFEMDSNLGLAPIGDGDLLVADFGPTNAFAHGPNSDGIVWRITPEGESSEVATGIGDPNFVVVFDDGSFLVSDDAVHEIWIVEPGSSARLFTTSIGHPNGMVLSQDGNTLYVAQIFDGINPLTWDNRIWSLPLQDGEVAGPPELLATTGNDLGPDGLAMDVLGRIYVACNLAGTIIRCDPSDGSTTLIAENMPGAASLAFGRGNFVHHALYATSTATGRVWEVPVGVTGAQLHH